MKTKTIIKKLEKLPELYDQIRELHTGDTSERVGLGLLTKEELAEQREYYDVVGLAHRAREEVEKKMEQPDVMPLYPPEYQVLAKRKGELDKLHQLYRGVDNALSCLSPSSYFGRNDVPFGISRLVSDVRELLKSSDSPEFEERRELAEKMEFKEREGTKVRRINQQVFQDWYRERSAAGDKASQAVLDENEAIVRRDKEIERAVLQRRTAMCKPIYAEIAELLRAVGK